MTISPVRCGLAFGAIVGLWHLLWSGLVAVGAAQTVLEFILRIHFLRVPITLLPFSASIAALLVAVTFGLGFLLGYVFAALWNWLHRARAAAPASA